MHYHFLHYPSEFLTALFDSAYELSHPPKSTLIVRQSTNQLSSKCLMSLCQKSHLMYVSKKLDLRKQSGSLCMCVHLTVWLSDICKRMSKNLLTSIPPSPEV